MRKVCSWGAPSKGMSFSEYPLGSHNVFHTRGFNRRDNIISQYTLWLPVAGREVN